MKNTLSSKALLVHLTISQWAGRKQDAEATKSVAKAFSTTGSAGAYHKKLLPDSKEFNDVTILASQIRKYFHLQTLPWLGDGTRIISSMNYIEFTQEMKRLKNQFDTAVSNFEKVYPSLMANAARSLGALYRSDEYPSKREISEKFGIHVAFLPMPDADDFRTEVTKEEREAFEDKIKEIEQGAKRECFDRLMEVVSKAKSKLASPKAVFRDSLVENINDLCNLLPKLNITGDKDLAKAIADLRVINLDANDLRNEAKTRKESAEMLSKVESRMGVLLKGLSK